MSASPRWPELPVTRTVILAPIGQNSLCLLGRRGRRINAIGACSSGSGAVRRAQRDRPMIKSHARKPRRLGKRQSFATACGSNRPDGMAVLRGEFRSPTNLADAGRTKQGMERVKAGRYPGLCSATSAMSFSRGPLGGSAGDLGVLLSLHRVLVALQVVVFAVKLCGRAMRLAALSWCSAAFVCA